MDSFCVLPFNHLQVMPSGTCKICCLAQEPISSLDEGKPLSLYENTYEEIWNSSYMQGIREKMVSGEPVKQCQRCYSDENITGQSRRTAMNDSWLTNEKLSDQDVKQKVQESHFIVENNPSFSKLESKHNVLEDYGLLLSTKKFRKFVRPKHCYCFEATKRD